MSESTSPIKRADLNLKQAVMQNVKPLIYLTASSTALLSKNTNTCPLIMLTDPPFHSSHLVLHEHSPIPATTVSETRAWVFSQQLTQIKLLPQVTIFHSKWSS